MKRYSILDRYKELLYNIESIEEKMVPIYAQELTRRHKAGWHIPKSTYERCKQSLYYKESLGRHSPYYVDLLKIEDRDNLKSVLLDLCQTIRIRDSIYD